MCEYLGYEVTALKRIDHQYIARYPCRSLSRFDRGWNQGIKRINRTFSKTEEASLPKPEAPKRRNEFIKKNDPDTRKKEIIIKDKTANTIYSFYFQNHLSF
jgi:23S rRNA pseudouridine2604 synthase